MREKISSGTSPKGHLGAIAFFALLMAFFYWKVVFGNSIFVFVDASRFFYPLWKWGAGTLRQGIIPLWNPDAQFGTPYFADPQMAYAYPPVPVLYLLLNPTNAFAFLIILHHFWALAGFWFLARAEGFSTKASLLGSLVFGFSLHLVCSSWTPVALMSISWIPWVFLGAGKAHRREKGGFLLLSFTWAMELAAGYPVLTYLTGLALGLHFGWKTLFNPGPSSLKGKWPELSGWRWVGLFFSAACLATAYNLVWGLPFMEFFTFSNYQQGANHFQDLHWLDLATAFSPFAQGHPLEADYHGPHYWVSTYFIGLPPLCLVVWGGLNSVYRRTSWGLLPLLLILSCGGLGLAEFLRAVLPGYALVIHSGFWISLLTLWAALLVSESVDVLVTLGGQRRGWFSWFVAALSVYGVSFFVGKPDPLALYLASFVLLVLVPFFKMPVFRWGLLLAALGLSLGPAANSVNILLDRSYYDEPPKVLSDLPKEGRLFFSPVLMEKARVLEGPTMALAYDTAKQSFYPNWPLAFGREEVPFYNSFQLNDTGAWTSRRPFLYSEAHSRNQLDFLGVRYLFGKNSFKDFKSVSVPGIPVEVSENPTPLPKWFAVERAFSGTQNVGDFLREQGATIRYGKECLIADGSKAGSYHLREVNFAGHGPNQVEITAKGEGTALIVSSETAYPGWKAWTNGGAVPVERINGSFRGIILKDGQQRALVFYHPDTFRLGLFTALLVLGFWCGLFFKDRIKE